MNMQKMPGQESPAKVPPPGSPDSDSPADHHETILKISSPQNS